MSNNNENREKRRVERVVTPLPVRVGRAVGITRDVSTSGAYFEIRGTDCLGIPVSFAMEVDTPNGRMVLNCTGDIVRIEPRENKVGIAVKITESTLVEAERVKQASMG